MTELTDDEVKARDAIEAGRAALSAPDVGGSFALVAQGLLEAALWYRAERDRLRADAQAAVAMVVEEAVAVAKRMSQDPAPHTCALHYRNEMALDIATAIRTLATADALGAVEALRKGRDEAVRCALMRRERLDVAEAALAAAQQREAEAQECVRALVSVARGYQSMPGYSLHPMLAAQCDVADAALSHHGRGE